MFHTDFDSKTLTWSGVQKVPIYNSNVTVGQVLLDALQRNPNKIGQINANNGIELTNEEIRIKSIRVAQNLQKLGFNKDHIFSFAASNNHHIASIVFGTLAIGAGVSTLDPSYTKNELIHMFRQINPSLVFCELENFATVNVALKESNVNTIIYCFDGPIDKAKSIEELFMDTGVEDEFVSPHIDGTKQIAFICCSSGTTGLSKGVCMSHACVLNMPSPFVKQHNVVLCLSSLYWASTIGFLISTTLKGAQRINITDKFSPELTLQTIEKYKITLAMTSPTILALLLESSALSTANLSSIKLLMCGGSLVHEHIRIQMNSYLPNGEVYVCYGISEPGGLLTMCYPKSVPGSVGKLTSMFQAKILNDNDEKCGINIDGEVCFKSIYPLLGYYNNQKATDEIMLDDGYFRTGDIGHFDADGYLYLVDRKKDILKYMSNHVSPSEIENVIMKLNGVKIVCVVGIPDVKYMDLPAAVIIRSDKDTNVTEDNVHEIVKENLPVTKQLYGGVYFVDSIPMTPSGKVVRRIAKDMAIELYNKGKSH